MKKNPYYTFNGNTSMKRSHAIKRAKERYGLVFTHDSIEQVVDIIKKKETAHGWYIFGWKTTNREGKHLVVYNGDLIKLVYDNIHKTIVTFLFLSTMDLSLYESVKKSQGNSSKYYKELRKNDTPM
jgi:hypothetical protein